MATPRSLVRLERGTGASRVFWEVSRSGASVKTRYGKHLSPGRSSEKAYATPKEATAAVNEAIAAKRADGYSEPAVRGEVGASSKKGVSVRNPELEAVIEEDPSDAERYLVYADWLQQQGDARGELIVVQHGIATDERGRSRFERDERELFKKFSAELLGPFAEYTFFRNSVRSFRVFSWRHGFIRSARLGPSAYTQRDPVELVVGLCAHAAGRFLERLLIGELTPRLARILESDAPKTLTSLTVGDFYNFDYAAKRSNLDALWQHLPRLKHLVAIGRVDSFGAFVAPALESLMFTAATEDNVPAVLRANAPKLRSLRVALTAPFNAGAVTKLVDAFPKLEHFGVQRWTTGGDWRDNSLIPEDDLAVSIVSAARARGLRRLDLEMPLTERGVDRVAEEARGLEELRMPAEAVEDDLKPRIEAAVRGETRVVWTDTLDVEETDLPEIEV